MKALLMIVALAAAAPCMAATDGDLSQKTSAQVRAIATTLRKEVAAGRANLQKAETQIRALDTYSREQWQRAENERRNAAKWRGRVLGGFAAGAVTGVIAMAFAMRPRKAPEVPVRRVRVRKTSGRKK